MLKLHVNYYIMYVALFKNRKRGKIFNYRANYVFSKENSIDKKYLCSAVAFQTNVRYQLYVSIHYVLLLKDCC